MRKQRGVARSLERARQDQTKRIPTSRKREDSQDSRHPPIPRKSLVFLRIYPVAIYFLSRPAHSTRKGNQGMRGGVKGSCPLSSPVFNFKSHSQLASLPRPSMTTTLHSCPPFRARSVRRGGTSFYSCYRCCRQRGQVSPGTTEAGAFLSCPAEE